MIFPNPRFESSNPQPRQPQAELPNATVSQIQTAVNDAAEQNTEAENTEQEAIKANCQKIQELEIELGFLSPRPDRNLLFAKHRSNRIDKNLTQTILTESETIIRDLKQRVAVKQNGLPSPIKTYLEKADEIAKITKGVYPALIVWGKLEELKNACNYKHPDFDLKKAETYMKATPIHQLSAASFGRASINWPAWNKRRLELKAKWVEYPQIFEELMSVMDFIEQKVSSLRFNYEDKPLRLAIHYAVKRISGSAGYHDYEMDMSFIRKFIEPPTSTDKPAVIPKPPFFQSKGEENNDVMDSRLGALIVRPVSFAKSSYQARKDMKIVEDAINKGLHLRYGYLKFPSLEEVQKDLFKGGSFQELHDLAKQAQKILRVIDHYEAKLNLKGNIIDLAYTDALYSVDNLIAKFILNTAESTDWWQRDSEFEKAFYQYLDECIAAAHFFWDTAVSKGYNPATDPYPENWPQLESEKFLNFWNEHIGINRALHEHWVKRWQDNDGKEIKEKISVRSHTAEFLNFRAWAQKYEVPDPIFPTKPMPFQLQKKLDQYFLSPTAEPKIEKYIEDLIRNKEWSELKNLLESQ